MKFKISQEAKSARVIQVIETVTLAGRWHGCESGL